MPPCYNGFQMLFIGPRQRVIEFLKRPRPSVIFCAVFTSPGGIQNPFNED